MTKKKRVVIVGAKFGELYLNSFIEAQPELELVGLVAKGSARAIHLADAFGVTLYKSLEDLPDDIDIACVVIRAAVIGGEGNHLVEALLRRGVHVIQEHPVSLRELLRHQQLAKEYSVHYWVNSFYPYIPVGQQFIKASHRVIEQSETLPTYGNISTSRQLLFSTLDILLQALFHDITFEIKLIEQDQCGFDIISLSSKTTHIVLRLQNYLDPNDPDMHNLAMHNMQLGWASGYLSLTDTYGPLSWTHVLHANNHLANQHSLFQIAGTSSGRYLQQSTTDILSMPPDSVQSGIEREGPAGVSLLLNKLVHCLKVQPVPHEVSSDFQSRLVSLWQAIVDLLGPPQERLLRPAPRIQLSPPKKNSLSKSVLPMKESLR